MTLVRYPQSVWNNFQDLERFFDEAFNSFYRGGNYSLEQRPAADWLEDEQAYTLQVELPGLDKDAVNVSIEKDVLTVEAKQEEAKENGQRRFHFRRSFYLPDTVNREAIGASMENGVLSLSLPKAQQALPRQIEVK
ncbi:MAG: molecular chaperone [Puniceicoccaceae bacterium 5H]|nr:MAG: molecular chaperone [Puniceicoccaceae bacterium 5H]